MAKVPDNQESLKKCICGDCPTHSECMKQKMEGLFCARSRSSCEVNRNGCVCGSCPLASEYQLDKMYYCETGAVE